MKTILATAILILTAAACAHASDPQPDWRDTVTKFAGCWDGEGLGGEVALCWMPGPGGRMTGVFQKTEGQSFDFSEIITVADFGDGPELRLKHFDGELKGWEEKDDYLSTELVGWTEDTLDFAWLRYRFVGDTRIEVELDMRTADGATLQTLTFEKAD